MVLGGVSAVVLTRVESCGTCWHYMKNVAMVNFVPMGRKQLEEKAEEAVQAINADPILLPSFFQHAKLKL